MIISNSSFVKKVIESKRVLDALYTKDPSLWNTSRASVSISLEDYLAALDKNIENLILDETEALTNEDSEMHETTIKALEDLDAEILREIERINRLKVKNTKVKI